MRSEGDFSRQKPSKLVPADAISTNKGVESSILLDEPRCDYLRAHDLRERVNDHTDWAFLHLRQLQARLSEKARTALARTKRNRAAAAAWVKRHYGPKPTAKPKRTAMARHT